MGSLVTNLALGDHPRVTADALCMTKAGKKCGECIKSCPALLAGSPGFVFVGFTHPVAYFSVCFLNDSNEFMVDFHHLNQL